MRIDALATQPHYHDHLAPLLAALPREVRGRYFGNEVTRQWAWRSPSRTNDSPIPEAGNIDRHSKDPVLVASWIDHHAVRPRPTCLINHGAGQSYRGGRDAEYSESYSGGRWRDRVLLHLEPGPLAARASRKAGYPYVETGCPKMDHWYLNPPTPDPRLAALTFHYDERRGVPEMRSARGYYEDALPAFVEGLRARGYDLIGHGHPRTQKTLVSLYQNLGVKMVERLEEVFERASVLVVDNSSAGVEFASLRRPVVWLSAPWYRREVEHGGRFWRFPNQGLHVENPAQLLSTVLVALEHSEGVVSRQEAMLRDVYSHVDGKATERAVEAILNVLSACSTL